MTAVLITLLGNYVEPLGQAVPWSWTSRHYSPSNGQAAIMKQHSVTTSKAWNISNNMVRTWYFDNSPLRRFLVWQQSHEVFN